MSLSLSPSFLLRCLPQDPSLAPVLKSALSALPAVMFSLAASSIEWQSGSRSASELAQVLSAAASAIGAIAILGGTYVGMFSGAHVRVSQGDDATLLYMDPGTGLAVVGNWSDPATPTHVPLEQVVCPSVSLLQVVAHGGVSMIMSTLFSVFCRCRWSFPR